MSVEVLSVRGLRSESRKIDRDLWLWFCEAKKEHENDNGPRITKRVVQEKAKQAFQAAGVCNFKASDGWYFRWLKRWNRVIGSDVKNLNEDQRGPSHAAIPRKQIHRKFKTHFSKAITNKTTRHETTSCGTTNVESVTCNPIDSVSADPIIDRTDRNLLLGIALSQKTSQTVDPLDAQGNLSTLPSEILLDTSNCDFVDTIFSKDYASSNGVQSLEVAHAEEFTSDTSSLVNLQDLAWNDLTDLSCFERPGLSKLSQTHESHNHPTLNTSKTLLIEPNLKVAVKEKGQLRASQKSSPDAGLYEENYFINNGSLNKGMSNQICPEQPNVQNLELFHNQTLENTVGFRCAKKMCFNSANFVPVRHASDSVPSKVNPVNQEEMSQAQMSVKNLSIASKSTTKVHFNSGKTSGFPNRQSVLGRSAAVSKRGKTGFLLSKETTNSTGDEKYADFEETSSGNFVQHYLEDVSVSSDFVNQLNDEHSLDLNLECGSENLSNQISCKVSLDKNMRSKSFGKVCGVEQPLNGFINLISSTPSDVTFESKDYVNPESGCHMSVVDDDYSSEDNDYISEAVMLSMQEDDFSILNCDQSPFPDTISVIDETSQSGCENMRDLDDGMQESHSQEEDVFDGEVIYPSANTSGFDITHQENAYPCDGRTFRGKTIKRSDISSFQILHNAGKNSYQSAIDNGCQEQEEFCSSSDPVNEENFLSTPNVLHLTTLNSKEHDNSRTLDMLQLSSSVIDVSSSRLLCPRLCPPLYGCLASKQLQESSSFINSDIMLEDGNLLQLTSSNGVISLSEGQDLLQMSSRKISEFVTDQDLFLACSTDSGKNNCSSSTDEKISRNSQNLLISENCCLPQNTEEVHSMYFVPCVSEKVSESVTHFGSSDFVLSNSTSPEMVSAISSPHDDSQHAGNTTNVGSTSVLLKSSSYHLHGNSVAKFVKVASPSTFVLKNTLPHASSTKKQKYRDDTQSAISMSSNNSTIESFESLSNSSPILCEPSEGNKSNAYNLQLVESVLSEQDDGPRNQPKLPQPKKNTVCPITKGNPTIKNKCISENQTTYRRSTGDRYFPYFKQRVVEYAVKHTAKEAAHHFGVNVDTITMWTRGRHETDSFVRNYPDQQMIRWLKKNRESGIILSKEQIVKKAVQLLKTPGGWLTGKTRWFHVWASRLANDAEEKKRLIDGNQDVDTIPTDRAEKKALYPEEFKVEVALYAEQTSKNLASSVFKIARKRVFEWSAALKVANQAGDGEEGTTDENMEETAVGFQTSKKQGTGDLSALISQSSREPKKFKLNGKGIGRAVTSVAVDHTLWLWFCEQTAKKRKPKSKEIRAKAVELFRAHNHDKIQCSHGWLKKWSLRYGIALRYEGDSDLVAWCLDQFDRNRNISHRDLLNYAHESLSGTHKSEFKASAGWLVRFCKRHRNLLSAKPSVDNEIPSVLKQRVSDFRSYVQKQIHSSTIPFGSIGCMDEVPLNFTAGGSQSRLLLRRSGFENCHAIVVLSCLATGELLPPAVIFKGEGPSEQVTFDDVTLLVFYQKECRMSASIMSEWLDLIWIRNVTNPSVLIADGFDPHCSETVKEKCDSSGVSLFIIPAGCSFKLQPLDLSISKSFESQINNRWTKQFSAVDHFSRCKRSSYSSNSDISRWVVEAYSSLKESKKEAIYRSFLVTGLTSALNGTEDHYIEDPSFLSSSSPVISPS